jgi:hypothetical protein
MSRSAALPQGGPLVLPLSSIWSHADLLKLGHHGSKHSSTEDWLPAALSVTITGEAGPVFVP